MDLEVPPLLKAIIGDGDPGDWRELTKEQFGNHIVIKKLIDEGADVNQGFNKLVNLEMRVHPFIWFFRFREVSDNQFFSIENYWTPLQFVALFYKKIPNLNLIR